MTDPDVQSSLRLAREALADARFLLNGERLRAAVNRAYYGVFYAAQAALLSVGETVRSHAGIKRRFSFHFIRTGRLSEDTGSILAFVEDARNRADYDVFTVFEPAAIADLIADANAFIEAVESLLQSP